MQFTNKTVLVTGHTGFKGSWLCAWLKQLGAHVVGVSLDVPTSPSHYAVAKMDSWLKDYRVDVRNTIAVEDLIQSVKPDIVFHLAAQALVRRSYADPVSTWQTNVLGTLNILEALRKLDRPCVAVMITSDKCYDNVEWVWGYRETDVLGGPDPYSASKAAAELVIRSHIRSFFPKATTKIRIASARAGNVIGGGDWAPDRIVPDCVQAWSQDGEVKLRNPNATRPWQHVLEPLSGYLCLAEALSQNLELHGESFNFGPNAECNKCVHDLVFEMSKHWKQVKWTQVENDGPHECGLLKLNCDKALHYLQWKATLPFEQTVQYTAEWYRDYYVHREEMESVTVSQIKNYIQTAKTQKLKWAMSI